MTRCNGTLVGDIPAVTSVYLASHIIIIILILLVVHPPPLTPIPLYHAQHTHPLFFQSLKVRALSPPQTTLPCCVLQPPPPPTHHCLSTGYLVGSHGTDSNLAQHVRQYRFRGLSLRVQNTTRCLHRPQHEDPDHVDISGDWTLLRFLEHSGTGMFEGLSCDSKLDLRLASSAKATYVEIFTFTIH